MLDLFPAAIFVSLMLAASASDVVSMTIPNRLCLALVAAFAVSAPLAGLSAAGISLHLAAGFVVLAITVALFALNWMGGGDAKLIAATALWFGPTADLADYVLIASIFGGVLTLVVILARAVRAPTTGLGFLDRLLDPSEGVPYGIALGPAAIVVFLDGRWAAMLT